MLYHLLYPLHELPGLSFLNVFRYITFRAAYAAVTALVVCFLLGPPLVGFLRRSRLGQRVRAEGPSSHLTKEGTPTMGGLLILAAIAVATLLWCNLTSRWVWIALGATLWLGALGFLDDYLRVVKGFRKGLLGRYKLAGQVILGLAVGAALLAWPEPSLSRHAAEASGALAPGGPLTPSATQVPFLKFRYLQLGWLFVPFVILVITSASNAVNLTDGLDGLASGLVAIVALVFAAIAYVSGHIKISGYLNIPYMAQSGELTVFCAALLGAALGFLWFNCHPADVFMGDTGSLALGGALGVVAVLLKREFWLVLVGGLFVAETVSVMLQVASFKLFGRRVFRMSPLHHHFELKGWAESRVVLRFYIVGILLALFSLSTFKLQ
jgi:phospho-N-acetylmuramoyl-pentapeptide-transferase